MTMKQKLIIFNYSKVNGSSQTPTRSAPN